MQKRPTRTILFFDTETGGIDPVKHSLLSIGLVVWKKSRIIDTCEIFIKDKRIKATPEALTVNQIIIKEHRKRAVPPPIAIGILLDFLKKNFNKKEKITLGGHNVNFDVNFLTYFLKKENINFNEYFSYRVIDTSSIFQYLYFSGKLKKHFTSLGDAIKYFHIEATDRHSALADAITTAKVFNALISL